MCCASVVKLQIKSADSERPFREKLFCIKILLIWPYAPPKTEWKNVNFQKKYVLEVELMHVYMCIWVCA